MRLNNTIIDNIFMIHVNNKYSSFRGLSKECINIFVLQPQLIGAGITSFAIYLHINPQIKANVLNDIGIGSSSDLFTAIIVVGSIIMLLGFLGCCGSLLESKCMLIVVSFNYFII